MKKFLIFAFVSLLCASVVRAETVVLTGGTIIDGNGGAPIHDGGMAALAVNLIRASIETRPKMA